MESSTILSYFDTICTIPRESGKEDRIVEYLKSFAKSNQLNYKEDEVGNVVIVREASIGLEKAPTVILQSHSDMVCEKNSNSSHNFDTDPIKYIIKDGWMIAPETTLGADCGIGMAAQLAILADKESSYPRIEALFTVEEETGLKGAKSLKPGFISGNLLINLDSEDEGEIFIGCAGGIDTTARFKFGTFSSKITNQKTVKVHFFGATGGHSGDDINKNRANAVQILSRFLYLLDKSVHFEIHNIDGGNKRNAIAREALAVISIDYINYPTLLEILKQVTAEVKTEHKISDPEFNSKIEELPNETNSIDTNVVRRLIYALNSAPHGVLEMSQEIPDFVETSTNLASVKTLSDTIVVATSQRSSINSARYNAANRLESIFKLAGAEVSHESEYPGWRPNTNSKLLEQGKKSYKKIFNREPVVRAIHAGLECGMFLDIYPDLDMISFGPTIRGVHAPGERLDLESLDKFTIFLDELLKSIN